MIVEEHSDRRDDDSTDVFWVTYKKKYDTVFYPTNYKAKNRLIFGFCKYS